MVVCNACYGQVDTGTTTIGIITSKKGQDTVKVYAILKNTSTKKQIKAIIYSVRQGYRWSEHNTPDAEPQYFFKRIKYLGQDKKPLPQNLTEIKATELK